MARAPLHRAWFAAALLGCAASARTAIVYPGAGDDDTGADSGFSGDLRYCIPQANADSGPTVRFANLLSQTVALTNTLPIITTSITFERLLSNTFTTPVTINGPISFRPFVVGEQGQTAVLNHSNTSHAMASGGDGRGGLGGIFSADGRSGGGLIAKGGNGNAGTTFPTGTGTTRQLASSGGGWSRTAGGNATSSPRAAIPAGGAAWNGSNSKINFNGSIRRLNGGEGDSGAYSVHGHADAGEFGSRGSGSALVPNLLVRDGSGLIKTGAGTRSIAAGNAHAGTTTTNGGTFAVPSLAIGRTASNLGQIASAPFVYSVTSSGDTGAGSGLSGDLRYCITQANLNSGSTVSFADLAGTTVVTLTGALPIITTSMTFAGLQSNTFTSPVTIDGGGLYRGFFVDAGAGAAVTFNYVQFQNTRAQGGAGGAGGGGGGAGMGSAIFVNSGAVTVNAATFAGGVTNGGAGGIGRVTTGGGTPDGGGGGGGAGGNGGTEVGGNVGGAGGGGLYGRGGDSFLGGGGGGGVMGDGGFGDNFAGQAAGGGGGGLLAGGNASGSVGGIGSTGGGNGGNYSAQTFATAGGPNGGGGGGANFSFDPGSNSGAAGGKFGGGGGAGPRITDGNQVGGAGGEFGGGGGNSTQGRAGNGGFGGGGGGGGTMASQNGGGAIPGDGGFGGGGGGSRNFNGAGGTYGGQGGAFSGSFTTGQGGGGGGAALGGYIFVCGDTAAATLSITSSNVPAASLTAGVGGATHSAGGGRPAATGGTALGTGLFLHGGTLQVGSDVFTAFGQNIFSGTIAGDTGAGVTKVLANTVTFSGANSYPGTTTINGGVLSVTANNNLGSTAPVAGVNFGGGTLLIGGTAAAFSSSRALVLNAGGGTLDAGVATNSMDFLAGGSVANGAKLLTLQGSGTGSIAGAIGNGSGGVTKTGPGAWTLAGANAYTGATTINGGTLSVSSLSNGGTASNLGQSPGASGNLVLNGGTLSYTGGSVSIDRGFRVDRATGGTINVSNAATNLTFTGSANFTSTNNDTLNKTGPGTLTLAGTTDNVGLGANVSGGTLVLAKINSTSAHSIGGAPGGLVIAGGTAQLAGTGGDQVYDGAGVTVNSGTFDLNARSETINSLNGSGGMITNNATGTSTLTVGDGGIANVGSGSYGGVIADGGSGKVLAMAKGGSGTLTLTNGTTHTGGTTVNGGVLVASYLSGSTVTVNAGGTLQLAGTDSLGYSAGSANLAIQGGTVVNAGTGNHTTLNVVNLTGGTLTAAGPGDGFSQALFLGGPVTSSASATTSFINSTSGGAITLAGSGSVTFDVAQGTTGSGVNLEISAVLTQQTGVSQGINKTGAGTLSLKGANTNTGAVVVTGGTLRADNVSGSASGSGPVSVGNGTANSGTLSGTGSISGAVTINSGGTLSPGQSPGILSVGSLNLASGSTFLVEIGGLTAGATGYDQLVVNGSVTLGGALQLALVDLGNGFSLQTGQKFFLLDNIGSGSAPTGEFSNAPGGLFSSGGNTFLLNYADNADGIPGAATPNDISLSVIAVPEPSSIALFDVAGLLALATRRREPSGRRLGSKVRGF